MKKAVDKETVEELDNGITGNSCYLYYIYVCYCVICENIGAIRV